MIDLHLDTTPSDGRLAPAEFVVRAATAGLTTISVTEHDTEARYRRMASTLGLAVAGGSDFHADPPQHIAGLGFVTLPPEDFAALEACAAGDRRPAR